MKPLFSSDFTLGILGGGQLGKMLLYDTRKMDIATKVLDPAADAPCRLASNRFETGSLLDYDTVLAFGADCDVLTIEIEHVNTEAMRELKRRGVQVHPDPDALELIQDKGLQKAFYAQHGIASSAYRLYNGLSELEAAITDRTQSLPVVWKSRRFGYDGKGVRILRTTADLIGLPDTPCLTEELVNIHRELAVVAARNQDGEIRCFPACEMVFHPVANLVEQVVCPAALPQALLDSAEAVAAQLIEQLGICGLLAVEFFVTPQGELLVNEVAPRPHNSGHFTIEACFSSQYEQHLRGILNLPLGDPSLKCPAVMVNLVGAEGYQGKVKYEGAAEILALPGVYLHVYGKTETRPFRKMGHVTVVRHELHEARELADRVSKTLNVISI